MADAQAALDRAPAQAVVAVLVTDGVTPYLPDTLAAIARQSRPADCMLVATTHDGSVDALHELLRAHSLDYASVVAVPGARNLGAAARRALAEHAHLWPDGIATPDLLWLLHDDSAPEEDALAAQLRAIGGGDTIAIVGAKQLDWSVQDRLISVGHTTTRRGQRFTGIGHGEIDQGQHDGRVDVLAAGTAGMLIRHQVWSELAGPDPVLGPFSDGLDLCRRARLAGYRVVIAPGARVRHARASFLGIRGPESRRRRDPDPRRSWTDRRVALLYVRLVSAAPLMAPLLLLQMLVAAPLRSMCRLVTKEVELVVAELAAPLAVLPLLRSARAARARVAATSKLPRRTLAPLHASPGTILRARRDARLHRAEQRRAANAPSELEIAERAQTARRRRFCLAAIVLVTVPVTTAGLGALVFAGPLIGGGLLPLDGDLGLLWSTVGASWVSSGAGFAGPADPFGMVLSIAAAVAGGPFGVQVNTVLTGLLVAAIPVAGLGAWFAAGAATRSTPVRLWAGIGWSFAPALLLGLLDGRIGSVTAHVLLPWVALGVARSLGVDRRDVVLSGLVGAKRVLPGAQALPPTAPRPARRPTGSIGAAAGAGLALAAAAAGAPVLLPVALIVLAVVAVAAGPSSRHAGRGRLALVALPAVALLGPSVAAALGRGEDLARFFLTSAELPVFAEPSLAWQHALGWPEPIPLWTPGPEALGMAMAAGGSVLIALAAVGALARGHGRIAPVRVGWLIALLGAAAAGVAGRVTIGADGSGQSDSLVRAWAGPGASLVVLGLLISACVGAHELPDSWFSAARGRRRLALAALVGLFLVAAIAPGAAWAWGVRSGEADLLLGGRGADPVPALGLQIQRDPSRGRVLALSVQDGQVRAAVWRGAGPQLADGSAVVTAASMTGSAASGQPAGLDSAQRSLAELVALLTVASDQSTDRLAEHAIGVVLLPPLDSVVFGSDSETARSRLAAALDSTAGLERVTENETGVVYRVASTVLTTRARLVSPDGASEALDSAGHRVAAEIDSSDVERWVVIAERADDGWRAEIDGRALDAIDGPGGRPGWRQAFTVPPGASGELRVWHELPGDRLWRVGQTSVLVVSTLLSIPTRRRRVIA